MSKTQLTMDRNAVELIVAIIALVDGQVIIVQTSLIGSMLSNLLLVMGMCFFFGGVNRLEQHFNPVVAQTAASLLALAVASLIIPTAFHEWSEGRSLCIHIYEQQLTHDQLVTGPWHSYLEVCTHPPTIIPISLTSSRNQRHPPSSLWLLPLLPTQVAHGDLQQPQPKGREAPTESRRRRRQPRDCADR